MMVFVMAVVLRDGVVVVVGVVSVGVVFLMMIMLVVVLRDVVVVVGVVCVGVVF